LNTYLFEYDKDNWKLQPNANSEYEPKNIKLALCFANKSSLQNIDLFENTKKQFPSADIVFCSTAGEILHDKVLNEGNILIAFDFKHTPLHSVSININEAKNSFDAAVQLVDKLPKENLKYIMVFSDGSKVNGSELVKGLNTAVQHNILITGGLAGDGANFESTLVGLNKQAAEGELVAIGFYGDNIHVNYGSQGGWTPFGLEKRVTKSSNNVLFELENENALDLYKKYLGDKAHQLPSAALSFPLSVTLPNGTQPIVRTILSIDEQSKTMTFAGDIPIGSKVKFMAASLHDLTEASSNAALYAKQDAIDNPNFALLVSCVGRKLVLGKNAIDEVNAVIKSFNNKTIVAGFYAYGEIAPFNDTRNCELHNQTMTITTFNEI
jgi:hypothetical protein